MGRRRRRQVVLLLLFFFLQAALLTLATSTTTAAADDSSSNPQPAITEEEVDEEGGGAESVMLLRKTTLGSRPPSCAGRCRASCGRRCEAVQVPVTPHDFLLVLRDRKKKETLQEAGAGSGGVNRGGVVRPSSYDDRSNYKPLGWRCRCLHS